MAKIKVNFFWVSEGDKVGVECGACGEKFFDRMSHPRKPGVKPRMLESGIPRAIEHSKTVHNSTGGQMGMDRPQPN